MRTWEYVDERGERASAGQRALAATLADGRLPVETPVRPAGSSRWRAAGTVGAFESALYPDAVLGPLPAFDAPDPARPRASYPPARPWVRLWARVVDLSLFTALVRSALALAGWDPGAGGHSLIGFAAVLAWVVVEGLCLAFAGTTPGRALLRVEVRRGDGSRLDFETALSRSFDVWLRGLAMGILLAAPVTCLLAYRRLRRDGVTSWDRAADCEVRHGPVGSARGGAAAGLLIVLALVGA